MTKESADQIKRIASDHSVESLTVMDTNEADVKKQELVIQKTYAQIDHVFKTVAEFVAKNDALSLLTTDEVLSVWSDEWKKNRTVLPEDVQSQVETIIRRLKSVVEEWRAVDRLPPNSARREIESDLASMLKLVETNLEQLAGKLKELL